MIETQWSRQIFACSEKDEIEAEKQTVRLKTVKIPKMKIEEFVY